MDYIGISFLLIGLFELIAKKKVNFKIVMQVLMMFSPLVIAAIVNPNPDVFVFLLRMYLVALYFVCYFKSTQLTVVELSCFTFPIVISLFYFLNPTVSKEISHVESRLSGIGDPNFTSLSLIISMCSAFGIYMIAKKKLIKTLMVSIIFICFWGVLLTASRSGFIGIIIALSLFLIIKKIEWYKFITIIFTLIVIAFNSDILVSVVSKLLVFERFESILSGQGSLIESIGTERSFTEQAWNTVYNGEWFIGGGPRLVIEWAEIFHYVPHNSLLDIGLAFGKVSFYFYSGFIFLLLVVNVYKFLKNIHYMDNEKIDELLSSLIFLTLIPMYLSLSLGLTMGFILWIVLGAYAILHHTKDSSKVSIFRRIKW